MAPSSSHRKHPTPRNSSPDRQPDSPNRQPDSPNHPSFHQHCPSATLDILVSFIIIFSGAFLIFSCYSYLSESFSLMFPSFSSESTHSDFNPQYQMIFLTVIIVLYTILVGFFFICSLRRSRRSQRNGFEDLKLEGSNRNRRHKN